MAEENLGTAVLSIVVDSAGLEASLNKAKQQIQKTSRELQRSLTTAPINPVTGRTARSERNDPVLAAIQQRRADQRALQTASGSGLGSFLRDVREREEGEKRIAAERAKGYKQANFAERTLTTFATKRAGLIKAAGTGGAGGGRLGGAISSGIIGGAFPLLFGQGGGAAAGGLIGGVAGGAFGGGGGFAGSLVGTLVGQQLDVFNQLAKALQDPVANFKQLVEASNLSSRGLEKYIQTLIDLGQTAEAESLIRRDISRTIDPTTLATTNAANEQYARTLADVQERLGAILAGPASKFISWLDEIIRRSGLLPGINQGPAPAEAQNRLGLANRGAGTAIGLGGISIAALGVAAAPFTGGASLLPAAIAGGGLAAAGAFQTQVGASLQDQAGSAELLKGVQQEILAVEQKRIAAQSKLVSLQQQGGATEAQKQAQAELQLQVGLLDIEAKRKKAKADFLARDASTESFKAYKLELDELKLIEKQLKANEAIRARAVEEQKRLTNIDTQLNTTVSGIKLQGIGEQIAATQALGKAERGVARDTLATTQAIQQGINEAKRREQEIGAQIDAARQRGGDAGEIEASRLVEQQKVAANQTKLAIEEGALALKEAGEKLAEDAKNAEAALRSAKEGSFDLLREKDQDALVKQAERDIRAANVFDPFKVSRLDERELISAASSARGIMQATENVNDITRASNLIKLTDINDLSENLNNYSTSIDNLTAITQDLVAKKWIVNVAVQNGQVAAIGDLVNGAL